MKKIFTAVGYYTTGRLEVASFTTFCAAKQFVKEVNDEVRATELEIEEITCVDDYGFPCERWEMVHEK